MSAVRPESDSVDLAVGADCDEVDTLVLTIRFDLNPKEDSVLIGEGTR